MNLPFTLPQFLEVFERYNQAIWPAQIVAYTAAMVVVLLVAMRSRHAGMAASIVLAAMWLINGVGYHLAYFSEINGAAIAFGAFFIVQAGLMVWHGVVRRGMQFSIRRDATSVIGGLAVVYAMIAYPLLGLALGHVYPAAPVLGVAPCPTTIFTLGILLLGRPSSPGMLFVIPAIWAVIGGSAAFLLGVWEDLGLIVAGVVTVVAVLFLRRSHGVVPAAPG